MALHERYLGLPNPDVKKNMEIGFRSTSQQLERLGEEFVRRLGEYKRTTAFWMPVKVLL